MVFGLSFLWCYLEGLEERVEVDENNLGDLVFTRVDKEQHVGDSQKWQEYKSGLHSFPIRGKRRERFILRCYLLLINENINI